MRRLFVAGNWKMNTLRASAVELASALARELRAPISGVQVAVCPPFPYLAAVLQAIEGSAVELGAQNAYHEPPGAFTGEVAAEMLVDAGCRWVILGHSERRLILGESDALINKKVATAIEKGLSVILCVGETLEQRQAEKTEAVLDSQMSGSLAGIDAGRMERIVIAYEPVWAIGTGIVATPDQVAEAHRWVREELGAAGRGDPGAVPILYGGSVDSKNAATLAAISEVDGFLVGGASLDAPGFLTIAAALEASEAARTG